MPNHPSHLHGFAIFELLAGQNGTNAGNDMRTECSNNCPSGFQFPTISYVKDVTGQEHIVVSLEIDWGKSVADIQNWVNGLPANVTSYYDMTKTDSLGCISDM